MRIRKRTLAAWGMAVLSLALLVGVLGMPKTTRPAAAQVDWCEHYQQGNDAFNNRGEINLEDYADDVVFQASPLCSPQECVGKDALRNYREYVLALDAQLTNISCEVSGNTVAVTDELRSRHTRAAGVDRIIYSSTYEFEGDKVLSTRTVGVDLNDPQTAQWVKWAAAGGPGPTLAMGPGRDADQSPGLAVLELYPDMSAVSVRVAPGPAGVPQPVNIHEGTCADLGPVAFGLKDMAGGVSWTVLEGVPGSDLQTGNLAVAVQKSHDEPDVYVACGDIPAAAAQVPPAVPAPAPVATGFADANGARLYYEVYGQGQPLLLIPGITLNHLSWQDEVPVYAPEFKVIVFDPRGTGQSSFPEGVDVTTALMADDAAALLDSLGVDTAHVLGWSLGGMVAQEMALRHPEKVRSLILSATSPGGPHAAPWEDWALAAFTAFLTQGRDVTTPNLLEIVFSPAYLANHHSQAVEYAEHLLAGPATPLPVIMAQAQAVTPGHETYDRLPSITAPTLILHGADDPLMPAENARILAQRIPGAKLILFEGARHAYFLEKQAEANAAVLDFLRQHAGQVPVPAALPAAGSVGLLGEEGSSLPTWWYALAAGGTLLIMGGLAGRWRARRRR